MGKVDKGALGLWRRISNNAPLAVLSFSLLRKIFSPKVLQDLPFTYAGELEWLSHVTQQNAG